ncbi:MAG: hypothetical protein ACC628_20945, partial [Pirellulaceae bacterium]
ILLGAFSLWVALFAKPVEADQPWEYAPYRVQIWLAVQPSASLNQRVQRILMETIVSRAELEIGAPWTLTLNQAPDSMFADVAFGLDKITTSEILNFDEEVLEEDKLFLLRVSANAREYALQAREFDCRTYRWGPIVTRTVRNPRELPRAAFDVVAAAFAPVTRIEGGKGKTAVVRLRAGGLVSSNDSPAYIGKGDVLLPIIRNNDRYGKATPDKINEIPWTLLQVTGRGQNNPSILDCNVYSGMRSPIRNRVSSRKERYAIGIRAVHESTRLVVESRVRKRDQQPPRLGGLEIYSKTPSPEPPVEKTADEKRQDERRDPPEYLGLTDWRGELEIGPGSAPCRILYIKNGGQLLARLPMVPGRELQQIAQVPDDAPRLQAEGYIKGVHGEIMDLVAQRQIMAAIVRRRIQQGRLDEADALLVQLQSLPTRKEIQQDIDQQQARQLLSPYQTVQSRIDTLYGDTRTMLGKYLDPNLGNQMRQEFQRAQSQPPQATPKPAATKSPAKPQPQAPRGSPQPAQ